VVEHFSLDPELLEVGPAPAEAMPDEPVPRDTRLDARWTAATLDVELPDLDGMLSRLGAELESSCTLA
jgi:hypothetical protein